MIAASEKEKRGTTHWTLFFLVLISLILFFLPFLLNPGYSVGGDDSRLYYLYPSEYFRNYLFQVMSGNGLGGNMGYMAVSHMAPMIGLFFLLKTIIPVVNVQHVFYGLNLSFGFLFCFLFFRFLIKAKRNAYAFAAMLASALYITSPYVVKTIYQVELIMIYSVSLVPIFLYMFTRGLEDRSLKYIVGSALCVAFLSSSILTLPWLVPVGIVWIPYGIYCAFHYRLFFWKSVCVFLAVSVGLNWYWLVHGVLGLLSTKADVSLVSMISSKAFIQESEDTMYSSIFLNGPMHQIVGYVRSSWTEYGVMPIGSLIGGIALLLVGVAGTKLKGISQELKTLFGVGIISLSIALCTITPNMGKWNMDVFLFLNRTIPMFAMFRNMASKFGLAMALASAFAVYLSLVILIEQKRKLWKWTACALGCILLLTQLPLFLESQGFGKQKQPFTKPDSQYMDMTKALSKLDTTKRFVWYPMTFAGYTPIQDYRNKDAWYLGLSPLQVLAGKSDIAGFYGIHTPIDPYRNWKMLELLKQNNYEEVIAILASYNVGYVITNNAQLPDAVGKQLDLFSFMSLQGEEYKKMLLGEKVSDFGTRFSLYLLNPKYSFDTVFVTNNSSDIQAPKRAVQFRKVRTNTYQVTLSPESDLQSLVLMAPYHVLWRATVAKENTDRVALLNHRAAYGFGNVWDIQKTENFIKPVIVTIEFIPDRFTAGSVVVSVLVFIGCIMYLCNPRKRK